MRNCACAEGRVVRLYPLGPVRRKQFQKFLRQPKPALLLAWPVILTVMEDGTLDNVWSSQKVNSKGNLIYSLGPSLNLRERTRVG
jgi:hypothetical protein